MRGRLPAEAIEVLTRTGGAGKRDTLAASAQRINDLLFGLQGEVAILKEQSAPGEGADAFQEQIHDIARGMESLLSVFDLMHGQMMGHLQALDEGERKGAS